MSDASGTVVDSSILLDVFTVDPTWGDWSQTELTRAAQRGALILNAVVVAEIAPRFERIETLRAALPSMAVIEEIPLAAAFLAGHAHANYRRAGGPREAILPDFLIGAHAAVTPAPAHARSPTSRHLHPRSPPHRSRQPHLTTAPWRPPPVSVGPRARSGTREITRVGLSTRGVAGYRQPERVRAR